LKQFVKKVFEVYRPFRLVMFGMLAFIAVAQIFNLFIPYLSGKVIDGMVTEKSLSYLFTLAGVTLLISLVRICILGFLREKYELMHIDFTIPAHVSHITLEKVLGFSIGQHVSENSGIKQSIISRGQHSLTALAYMMLYQVFPMIIEVIMLIGALLYFSLILGLVVLFGVLIFAIAVIYINCKFHKDFRKTEKMYNEDNKFRGEVLKNVELVISNAQESRAVKECDESLDKAQSWNQRLWLRFNVFATIRNVIIAFTSFCVLIIGICLVKISKTHSVGQVVMFLAWSATALGRISDFGYLHRQILQMYTTVRKYFDMLSIESDIKVIPNPVRPTMFAGRIEFKDVTFKYKRRDTPSQNDDDEDDPAEEKIGQDTAPVEQNPALKNVSFVIEPGQRVAFVGESGAGKSTIVHTLIRAQDPDEGQITVDGNDLRVLDLKRYREHIGIVDQQVFLFDHTLRYNITYGLNGHSSKVTDDTLDRISEMSCINRFFNRLEKGYDTIIGERGVKLSGGERQRVGIARALIKEPDILIFDEATSNLDSENEFLIRESIEKASKGRTTIIIAHRFSTIKQVDKVFVFDKGELVGQGTHEELAETCDAYQRLVKNQTTF